MEVVFSIPELRIRFVDPFAICLATTSKCWRQTIRDENWLGMLRVGERMRLAVRYGCPAIIESLPSSTVRFMVDKFRRAVFKTVVERRYAATYTVLRSYAEPKSEDGYTTCEILTAPPAIFNDMLTNTSLIDQQVLSAAIHNRHFARARTIMEAWAADHRFITVPEPMLQRALYYFVDTHDLDHYRFWRRHCRRGLGERLADSKRPYQLTTLKILHEEFDDLRDAAEELLATGNLYINEREYLMRIMEPDKMIMLLCNSPRMMKDYMPTCDLSMLLTASHRNVDRLLTELPIELIDWARWLDAYKTRALPRLLLEKYVSICEYLQTNNRLSLVETLGIDTDTELLWNHAIKRGWQPVLNLIAKKHEIDLTVCDPVVLTYAPLDELARHSRCKRIELSLSRTLSNDDGLARLRAAIIADEEKQVAILCDCNSAKEPSPLRLAIKHNRYRLVMYCTANLSTEYLCEMLGYAMELNRDEIVGFLTDVLYH